MTTDPRRTGDAGPRFQRPVPIIGDGSSAAERGGDPSGWRLAEDVRQHLRQVIVARRDVRRYRPDPVPADVLRRVLEAGHRAPSVGHSQPWRFVVVDDPEIRHRAAHLADTQRLTQAAELEVEAGRHPLDPQLEGIREAPLGVVVCCDRRTSASGVLGRATFPDADVWSCACAIENMWLAARAEGLGLGWVTFFRPDDLQELCGLPSGVVTLGWLCVGWPDERPPEPGLERAGWSHRLPLDDVVFANRWAADEGSTPSPVSRLAAPAAARVVSTRDDADTVLLPPSALGVLDRAVDRVVTLGRSEESGGTLVLAYARHLVAAEGVTPYLASVGEDLLSAAHAGTSGGAAAARTAGLGFEVVDTGSATGNLCDDDPMTTGAVERLVADGVRHGERAGRSGLVAVGEIGLGNTTVAAALAAQLLGLSAADAVGRGSGADSRMIERKRDVVASALRRWATTRSGVLGAAAPPDASTVDLLAALGGPEIAYLTGVLLGAAQVGAVIVLDGLATGVAALLAVRGEPAVSEHLVAGQRSRERLHARVLVELGLEPLLDLRLGAGEGIGASLAARLLLGGLAVRRDTARTR